MKKKEAIVLHSGGMDSSICLALAIKRYGKDAVLSLGFSYGQRHNSELQAASHIADHFGVERYVMEIPFMEGWQKSSLLSNKIPIKDGPFYPNSFVPGRNGLFLMLASTIAYASGARKIYIGVMELEGAYSGYPDCSSEYLQAVQTVLQLDLQDTSLQIEAPLLQMTKKKTMETAFSLGILDFLLENTITCYEGIPKEGCQKCPACRLRNEGVFEFFHDA